MAIADHRIDRSRRRLHDSLVTLILERGWDRVSVQAVCAKAKVGRSTFYVHFADKEDLLVGGLDHVRDDLRRRHSSAREPFGFVRGMIDHADQSRRLFRAVIGKRSGLAVQRKFREVVLDLMVDELRDRGITDLTTARFLTGALVELLFAWVDGKDRAPASEVESHFVRLAAPVVAAAR